MQPLSSNQKYQKVEAHTRNAKPSLTKEDSVFKAVYLTCNKCYFDARHDFCVVQHLSEVNDHASAKAVKCIKMKEWKPTGHTNRTLYKCAPVLKWSMASEHSSSGPALHEMTPIIISSGLVPNPPPSTPFVPPSRSDWDLLFQPLFDVLLTLPPSVDHPSLEVIAPIDEVVALFPAISTGSPSLTTVDQDAPSPSNSQTTPETQSPIFPNDVEEDNHDLDVAHMNNDPFFGIPIPENDLKHLLIRMLFLLSCNLLLLTQNTLLNGPRIIL
ncbi:hypothetical protein Tco_0453195 [Tanacetum coccineum]